MLALRFLRRGQFRLAHRQAMDVVTANPRDPDLHAVLGAVLVEGGQPADALQAFGDAPGSGWYETRGLPYHARALALSGRCVEAAALRGGYEVAGRRPPSASLGIRLAQLDDLRMCGDAVQAEVNAVVDSLLAEYPGAGSSWAAAAQVAIDAGRVDEAGWLLVLAAEADGQTTSRTRMARAEWALAAGFPADAWTVTESLRRSLPHDAELWALRMRILRALDQPEAAVAMAELERFAWSDDPRLRVQEVWARMETGDLDGARLVLHRLQDTVPQHPDVLALGELL